MVAVIMIGLIAAGVVLSIILTIQAQDAFAIMRDIQDEEPN